MSTSRTIAITMGLAVSGLLGAWHELGASAPNEPAAPRQAAPVDREAWARKMTGLNEADWRTAYQIGQELAALPDDEGFAILKANWPKIGNVGARQQLLKGWNFATPSPLRPGDHPRLLDGLDLGMRDPSPDVQNWAINYLNDLAFQDFSEDFPTYKAWYQANRDKPLTEVIAQSARRCADRSGPSGQDRRAAAGKQARRVRSDLPASARSAPGGSGLRSLANARTLDDGAQQAGAPPKEIELAEDALRIIGELKPGEAELRRLVVPHISKEKPAEIRTAAIGALGGRENAWAIDLLLVVLTQNLEDNGDQTRLIFWDTAGILASFDNPRVIPTMIAVIDADNTYDTVYGVGHFGLGRLSGVTYDESHDGAWWRQWWEKNKERYPEPVRALKIPELPKRRQAAEPAPADPLADVADVPAQDFRAGGDEKKRYFLIGATDARPPAAGYGLLIVLAGGDGSADFHPFIRRIHKNVLNDRWLIAQAVAPKWDENQFNQVVWPTALLPYPGARFTTEEFIRAIGDDVRTRVKIDPRKVILLGWSSGGPPCYAMALRKDSGVTGAFIAMSVFLPEPMLALENARDKAFYLLQSPQDQVTPVRHAEAAEKALQAAGAKVRLQRYEGGHGWRGDVWSMIGDGITWLDHQIESK